MSYFTQSGVPITTDYSPQATFPPSGTFPEAFSKLDVFSNGTDAIAQLMEVGDTGWQNIRALEILCPQGFNSIPVDTPFVAVRFRVWEDTLLAAAGTVHMRCFG